MRGRSGTDVDTRMRQQQQQQMTQQLQQSTNLSRSRSAQSLKQLADQSSSDDKMTVRMCFFVFLLFSFMLCCLNFFLFF